MWRVRWPALPWPEHHVASPHREIRPRTPVALRVGALGLLGVLLLVAGMGSLVLRLGDLLVPRTEIRAIEQRDHEPPPPEPDASAAPAVTGITNVLVVGLDSRTGLTDEQLLALGTEDVGTHLTDTVMWVQVDADADEIRMVSFPRDLRVEPSPGARPVKLNALHNIGGPDLLVSTLEGFVGADLDHYVEIDLAGFLRLADAVGGVQVCLSNPMVDVDAGVDLPPGCQLLDATDAAGYVRARQVSDEFGVGTAGRAMRQQYYIRQAVRKVVSAGTLTNPSRLRAMVGVARDSVVVDEGFSTSELLRFADRFRAFDSARMDGATVPVRGARVDGLYYDLLTDESEAVFTALREGAGLGALADADEPDVSASAAGTGSP